MRANGELPMDHNPFMTVNMFGRWGGGEVGVCRQTALPVVNISAPTVSASHAGGLHQITAAMPAPFATSPSNKV